MKIQTNILWKSLCAFLVSFVLVQNASAQESAQSIARKLENNMLSGQGVSMKFNLAGEGKVSVTADLKSHRIRMESPSTLIISDGTTIWNYNKPAKRVTIDNISGNSSPFKDPGSVFRFSSNYTPRITSQTGSKYTIELTPTAQLAALMKAAGDMQHLTLSVKVSGNNVSITKAVATSARGQSQAGAMSITSLKSIKTSDFVYTPSAGVKVTDLRE